jgi:squalene synthase HpnC
VAQLSVTEEIARYQAAGHGMPAQGSMLAQGNAGLGAAAVTRDEARAYCRRFVRSHSENFTVASWLLPRRLVPHFCSIYAYCRFADDLADELGNPNESLAALDWWETELDRCYAGAPRHPVFVALRSTIDEFSIPREPFSRLLTAFRQDQRTVRYGTHDDVLGYCRNSADPVGRLILYLGRSHDARRGELSDSICTGLHLINFCQDLARDWRRGRLYLPHETLESVGCSEADFQRANLERGGAIDALRRALRIEVDRAESYLLGGRELVELVPRELRVEVSLFLAGGLSVVDAIRRQDHDVWRRRPTVSAAKKLRLLVGCWWNPFRFSRKEAPR